MKTSKQFTALKGMVEPKSIGCQRFAALNVLEGARN